MAVIAHGGAAGLAVELGLVLVFSALVVAVAINERRRQRRRDDSVP